jgi:hypothetical protein
MICSGAERRYNLQTQANRHAAVTSVRPQAPETLAHILPKVNSVTAPAQIKAAFKKSGENQGEKVVVN